MSDLIDRAEVMKLLDEQCWNGMFTYFRGEHHVNCFRELVKAIPSIENKGDLISRQAVENITWEEPSYSDPLNVLTEVREKVRALPSVENEGEWTEWKGRNGRYKGIPICSNCNTGFPVYAKEYKFCPECGADMRGKI